MDDLINRQAAIDILKHNYPSDCFTDLCWAVDIAIKALSAQSEPRYCRECKWSRYHINVGKHGKSEIYWWCLNWVGETDEEGYCHEWKRKTDG